jgi:hypothetical protein
MIERQVWVDVASENKVRSAVRSRGPDVTTGSVAKDAVALLIDLAYPRPTLVRLSDRRDEP